VEAWPLLVAALLLAPERICYVWIARYPQAFRCACATPAVAWIGEPVAVVAALFAVGKTLQCAAFAFWFYVHGRVGPWTPTPVVLDTAWGLVVIGQVLNWGVFYRLRYVGVFFGDRLGYEIPWIRAFPFSWVAHPQYLGTVLTIWGLFLAVRFPHPDWYLLPVVETLFYAVGARLESGPSPRPEPARRYGTTAGRSARRSAAAVSAASVSASGNRASTSSPSGSRSR
jgi:hypothetical protein